MVEEISAAKRKYSKLLLQYKDSLDLLEVQNIMLQVNLISGLVT